MIFNKKLTISMRLILGFGLVLILTTFLGLIGINEMQKLTNLTAKMYKHPMEVNKSAKNIKTNIFAMQASMNKVALSKYTAEITALQTTIKEYEKDIYKSFNIIKERYLGDTVQVHQVFQTFEKWNNLNKEVINLFKKRKKEEAIELSQFEVARKGKKINREIELLINLSTNEADSYLEKAKEKEENMIKTMFVLLIVIIILGIVFSVLIIRSITYPINKIVHFIKAIENGELNQKIEIYRNDEIGKLAISLREMQTNLRQKTAIARRIALGDFSIKMEIKSKNDILAKAINEIIDTFNQVVKQANLISLGNYSTDIIPRNKRDTIGIALQKMLKTLREVDEVTKRIVKGDFVTKIIPKSEKDDLSISLNEMLKSLRETKHENYLQNLMKTGQNQLNQKMRGDLDIPSLTENIISYLSEFLNAKIGVLYLKNENQLKLTASYAFSSKRENHIFEIGEGLIGQCALEQKILLVNQLPENYLNIQSGIGKATPNHAIIAPIIFEKEVKAVIEFASFNEFKELDIDFLKSVSETIGIVLNSSQSRTKMQKLLEEKREQAEILQKQQEELQSTNEELETQTIELQRREERLRSQRIELEVVNKELRIKTVDLENQKDEVTKKNIEIAQKIKELEKSSQYKSEFLANMSHELRTPLNSLLILSKSLSENSEKNLDNSQIEATQIIYKSGKDLLNLINDILDLSKIEAGKMDIHIEKVVLQEVIDNVVSYFSYFISQKDINFKLNIAKNVPCFLQTDAQRLGQIIKNLLSNAIKFTESGDVNLDIFIPDKNDFKSKSNKKILAISVKDTGIGIPQEKQDEIFEAFQQADGTTSRKFGGTGLGLSISKELANLLGGTIHLKSQINEGSTFTICLYYDEKDNNFSVNKDKFIEIEEVKKEEKIIVKNENLINKKMKNILLIEDDKTSIQKIEEVLNSENLKITSVGNSNEALQILRNEHHFDGIILDLILPDISGFDLLKLLGRNKKAKMPPVIIYTAKDLTLKEVKELNKFAKAVVIKGLNSEKILLEKMSLFLNNFEKKQLAKKLIFKDKKVLVVDDDMRNVFALSKILKDKNMKVLKTVNGEKALEILEKEEDISLVLMDIMMPKMDGYETIKRIRKQEKFKDLHIIALTAKAMKKDKEKCLAVGANEYISKPVNTETLFLTIEKLFKD